MAKNLTDRRANELIARIDALQLAIVKLADEANLYNETNSRVHNDIWNSVQHTAKAVDELSIAREYLELAQRHAQPEPPTALDAAVAAAPDDAAKEAQIKAWANDPSWATLAQREREREDAMYAAMDHSSTPPENDEPATPVTRCAKCGYDLKAGEVADVKGQCSQCHYYDEELNPVNEQSKTILEEMGRAPRKNRHAD